MADLARRATRWVGTFPYILTPIPNHYDHSFPRYGQITFLTFRRPTTLTFDLKFWKYLSVTVYPYVICMPSFIMIGWEMAEILHFEILRKHGQTNTHTNKHTNKAIRDGRPRPPRHQCVYQISSWSVEKWLRYYTLKFCENTDKHTDRQTDMGITIPRPPPMGGEVTNRHGHYNTSPSPYGGRGNDEYEIA